MVVRWGAEWNYVDCVELCLVLAASNLGVPLPWLLIFTKLVQQLYKLMLTVMGLQIRVTK